MLRRTTIVLTGALIALAVVGRTSGAPRRLALPHPEWDGLGRALDADLARGSRVWAADIVHRLESTPIPVHEGRDALVETLVGVLSRHGARDLVGRVLALRPGLARRSPARVDPLVFPGDHGAHLGSVTEWWYFNGHVDGGGRSYAYELCFFKTIVGVEFVHVALTDETQGTHPFARSFFDPRRTRTARGRLDLVFGPHRARETATGTIELVTVLEGRTIELSLRPRRAPMLVNGDGVIDMPEGLTSRYYSYTRLETTGTMRDASGAVTRLTGLSWHDHQWGAFISLFRPWDWFGLQLDDGTDYNVFHFRAKGTGPGRTDVTVLTPEGTTATSIPVAITRRDWWRSPRTGDWFVTSWGLAMEGRGETFDVRATTPDQEMPRVGPFDVPPAYWEGSVSVERHGPDGRIVRGVGFSEHMPYRAPRDR